jgi:hypothetical protein
MVLEVGKLTDEELTVIDRGLSLIECNFPESDDIPAVNMLLALIELEAIKRGFY